MAKTEHSEEQLRHILGYIGIVRDEMRMQNWDVILHRTAHNDDDCHAYTWHEHNHTTLNIELGPGLFDESPERIRNTVVHELIHAQHRDVTRLWDGCTKDNTDVPTSQSHAWDVDFHVLMERFVSWITQRVGPTVSEFSKAKKYPVREGCYLLGEHSA